jgi:hypothetical protein
MVNGKPIAWGIVFVFLGILLAASVVFVALGVLSILAGAGLIVLGAVTKPPMAPQPYVVVPQPYPVYYPQQPPPPPSYYPTPAQPPVNVHVHQAAAQVAPPQVMWRCRYCSTVYPETAGKCPQCGAAF